MQVLGVIGAVLIGYLLGSIPAGYLVCKYVCGTDVRRHGSGSTGTTNTLRVAGKKWALAVLIFDVGKGALAACLGGLIGGQLGGYLAGMVAIASHMFPVWLGFKGGKGAATAYGVLLFFWPQAALYTAIIWIAVLLLSGIVSLATIAVIFFNAVYVLAAPAPQLPAWVFLPSLALILFKHKDNIKRLIAGKENKVLWKNRKFI